MSPLRYTTTIPIPGPPSASPFATSDNSYGHEHHDDDPRLALLRPTTELALESDGRWYYHHDDNAVADPVDSATAGADFVSAVATLAWDRTKGIRWT